MEKRQLTCIRCPRGCQIMVEVENNEVIEIEGNGCMRGEVYAKNEVKDPRRVVTTTVSVTGGKAAVVAVKTNGDIPKDKVQACVEALKDVSCVAPVQIGDVVCKDIVGTGIDVVATSNVEA